MLRRYATIVPIALLLVPAGGAGAGYGNGAERECVMDTPRSLDELASGRMMSRRPRAARLGTG